MKRLPILIVMALLLTASVVMASYLLIYHASYEIEYDDIEVTETQYADGVLTLKVKTEIPGEYLYRVIGAPNEKGEFELTFRGGKQGALAQTKGEDTAVFEIEIPDEYKKIVCGKSTVYTIVKGEDD